MKPRQFKSLSQPQIFNSSMSCFTYLIHVSESFPGDSVVKTLSANAGDTGDSDLIPGSGRSPGGGKGNPLQYSCVENYMDREAWQAEVHGVAKSWM